MRVETSQEIKAFNNRTNLTIVELPDGLIINLNVSCFGLEIINFVWHLNSALLK